MCIFVRERNRPLSFASVGKIGKLIFIVNEELKCQRRQKKGKEVGKESNYNIKLSSNVAKG